MAQTSYKAVALAQSLAADLNARFSGTLSFTINVDTTDGAPYLSTGSGVAGAQNVIIKLVNYLQLQDELAVAASKPLPYTDSFGRTPGLYTPNTAQVVTEAASGAPTLSLVALSTLGRVLGDVFARDMLVELYLTTNGVPPTPGAGTLVASYSTSLQYRGTSNV